MTLIVRCDACGKAISPEQGDAASRDRALIVEVQTSDAPNRRRHYHRTPECWDAVRAGLNEVEQEIRQATG